MIHTYMLYMLCSQSPGRHRGLPGPRLLAARLPRPGAGGGHGGHRAPLQRLGLGDAPGAAGAPAFQWTPGREAQPLGTIGNHWEVLGGGAGDHFGNVGVAMPETIPPIIIFMGGIPTIKNGWFITLLYPGDFPR